MPGYRCRFPEPGPAQAGSQSASALPPPPDHRCSAPDRPSGRPGQTPNCHRIGCRPARWPRRSAKPVKILARCHTDRSEPGSANRRQTAPGAAARRAPGSSGGSAPPAENRRSAAAGKPTQKPTPPAMNPGVSAPAGWPTAQPGPGQRQPGKFFPGCVRAAGAAQRWR